MSFEIIDFHTHPFSDVRTNICAHKDFCRMSADNTREIFASLNVTKICGSVISLSKKTAWADIQKNNAAALKLRELYGDFYVPGFHVHPHYVDESIAEIRRMSSLRINLIGELVPYLDGWEDYSSEEFSHLLDEAAKHNMVVSLHSWDKYDNSMDNMLQHHRDIIVVGAHPGEYPDFMRHIERMKRFENYYLDISGLGPHRYGMLRRAIDEVGADRILFGSDFPTCSPATFIGSVLLDPLLTDSEKEQIFSQNAKRLLRI
ncbi:MAG: amidohydrolase [Oscillospiraceae bacterium]|nr:amidohydrolase [Oscillospiraceae bacterium]